MKDPGLESSSAHKDPDGSSSQSHVEGHPDDAFDVPLWEEATVCLSKPRNKPSALRSTAFWKAAIWKATSTCGQVL